METFYLVNSEIFGLSNSTAVIYNFLCRVNNVHDGKSFYGRKAIARACDVSLSTVIRALRSLCEKGLLEIRQRFDHGRQTSNDYILLDNPQMKIITQNTSKQNEDPETARKSGRNLQTRPRLFACRPTTAKLSANETKVFSYLSYRADKDGKCMPAKKEIAVDCKISVSTVGRAIKALIRHGLIKVYPQTRADVFGNNGTSVNLYVISKPSPKASEAPSSSQRKPFYDQDSNAVDSPVASERRSEAHTGIPCTASNNFAASHLALSPKSLLRSPIQTRLFNRLSDTLPHISHGTPGTTPRKKITDNSRSKSLLTLLAEWYRKIIGVDECRNE